MVGGFVAACLSEKSLRAAALLGTPRPACRLRSSSMRPALEMFMTYRLSGITLLCDHSRELVRRRALLSEGVPAGLVAIRNRLRPRLGFERTRPWVRWDED